MRELYEYGNKVYVVAALERREQQRISIENDKGIKVLRVKTLNIQKTNVIEKEIGTLTLENAFIKEIKLYKEKKLPLTIRELVTVYGGKDVGNFEKTYKGLIDKGFVHYDGKEKA